MNDAQGSPDARHGLRTRRSFMGLTWVGWIGVALAIAAIIIVGLLLARTAGTTTITAASVRDILASPQQYVGQRVVVSGRVEDVLTHRALTVGTDLSADPLLVLVETEALVYGYDLGGVAPLEHGPLYQEQDVVQFLGTVERFDRASLATRLDIVLNDELFGYLEGQPVLLVDRLDVATLGMVLPSPVPGAESPSAGASPATASED